VVAGHSTDYLLAQNGNVPSALQWIHGPAGVDIFFVLSGFVMTISAGGVLQTPPSPMGFMMRRLIRIVPLYWLLTALKVLLIFRAPQLSEHGLPSLWNSVSSFLFIPSLNASGEIRPVIPLGWTLSFEMLFYVIFALGLLAPKRLFTFVTPAVLLVALVGLVHTSAWPAWTALADPIVLEFLAGMCIARWTISRRLPRPPVAAILVATGFLGFALLSPESAVNRVFTWGVCAGLIVLGTVSLEKTIAAHVPTLLLLLGDASYSIYLVQSFIFPALHRLLAHASPLLVHTHAVRAGVTLIVLSLLATSFAGILMHRCIERPITLGLRRLGGFRAPTTVTP
jgi:peptidoglycan/LPS O-acetylase OafA/YrhL